MEMDKYIYPTFYWAHDYVFMVSKLIHVKGAPDVRKSLNCFCFRNTIFHEQNLFTNATYTISFLF